MDSGTAGLINTINLLDGEKILHTGAHINSRKASEPAILDLGILTMGVISCADDEGQIAGRNSPGVAEATEKNVLRAVAALKNRVDVIILCLHMGLEFEHYPDSYKVSLARKSASAGANVTLCHHPHVLQGIEVHNGSLICYILANYVFHVHGNAYQDHCLPYSAWSVMVKIKLSKAGYMSHVLVPVVLGADHRPSLVQGPDRERIIDHIERISMPLHDGECIERLYRSACKRCARENYWWFRGFLRANKFRLVGKRFWILINRSPQRRWIAGYFRHLLSPLTDSFRKNSVDNRLLGYRPINWEEKTGE
jgi:poly-gamma-glutamate synthesis protein (capsule biosynthesis protein)